MIFKELSKEKQEELLEKYRDVNGNYDWWDGYLESFVEDCKEKGIIVDRGDITFDLDRNSHFGVSTIDFELKKPQCLSIELISKARKIGYFYSDFPTMSWNKTRGDVFQIELWGSKNKSRDIERISKQINEKVDIFGKLCEEYYHKLQKEYEYMYTDEAVIDYIENNVDIEEEINE